jgi:hypothetical protein
LRAQGRQIRACSFELFKVLVLLRSADHLHEAALHHIPLPGITLVSGDAQDADESLGPVPRSYVLR